MRRKKLNLWNLPLMKKREYVWKILGLLLIVISMGLFMNGHVFGTQTPGYAAIIGFTGTTLLAFRLKRIKISPS